MKRLIFTIGNVVLHVNCLPVQNDCVQAFTSRRLGKSVHSQSNGNPIQPPQRAIKCIYRRASTIIMRLYIQHRHSHTHTRNNTTQKKTHTIMYKSVLLAKSARNWPILHHHASENCAISAPSVCVCVCSVRAELYDYCIYMRCRTRRTLDDDDEGVCACGREQEEVNALHAEVRCNGFVGGCFR